MLSLEEIRVISDITDTTWGRTSTGRTPTMSFTAKLINDTELKVMYKTIAIFANEIDRRAQMSKLEAEGEQAIGKYIARVKDEFREKAGRVLKTKILKGHPEMEIIQLQPHVSPKRNVYFRYTAIVSLE